jgi:hypothetical protein
MGVITMKMISSTSMTSTMGVTLMLELTLAPSFRIESDINFSPAQIQRVGLGSEAGPAGVFAPAGP